MEARAHAAMNLATRRLEERSARFRSMVPLVPAPSAAELLQIADEAARQFTLGLDGELPLEPADVELVIATILGRMMITVFVSIGQERASLVGLIDRVMAEKTAPAGLR